jgi:hypothetical protein
MLCPDPPDSLQVGVRLGWWLDDSDADANNNADADTDADADVTDRCVGGFRLEATSTPSDRDDDAGER